MAKLFCSERIVPAWLSAVRSLATAPARTDRNFVLEIASPTTLDADDVAVINAVDVELRKTNGEVGVYTVAATIFPQRMYLRHGRPAFYGRFLTAMKKGQKPNTWGTYAMRMMERTHPRTRNQRRCKPSRAAKSWSSSKVSATMWHHSRPLQQIASEST